MRFRELKENGGLIVPGVNTTVDVGPNEIPKQAKKFGNSVDKQGKPLYTMHKKAHKNSDPNTLFNLGMAESKKDIKKPIKARDPNWKDMEALRKSGAAGSHKDKSKIIPRKQKYKNVDERMGKELSSATEIFVDMDGVLADFFPAWKKLVGADWREIKDIEDALQKIRDKEDFWLSLPLTPNAKGLLNIIKDLKGEYKILSAPLANDPKAEPHKREWVKDNLSFFPPKEVIITADKWKFAKQADGTPNILIDDFGSNIRNWESKGGVGFKHKDHKFERTAGNLKDYFKKPAEEVTDEGITDKLSGFADKILGKMEKWWNKQVNAHEMAWAEVEKILKPYAEELRDLIKDPNDFGMLMLLIKHNQGKKPLLDKLFAKIRQFGIKAVYKMQGLEDKFATEGIEEGALSIPASKLPSFVSDMVKNLDPNRTKDLMDIARKLGKEVYVKKDRIVIQDPDFDPHKKDEGELIPNPKNTSLVKSDSDYDFMKLGTNIANVKDVDPEDVNPNDPDIMLQFWGGEKEKKYMMKQLKRLGYDIQDADKPGDDAQYDERELTKGEEKDKERIVKGMKKGSADFKKRYGDNWKAVMYATATKLAKEGYDLTETGYEDPSYFYITNGMAPPQVREEDLQEFTNEEVYMDISLIKPVQRNRSWDKLHKQMTRVKEGNYAPIVIDNTGYIVNGHHRYDALRFMGETDAKVRIMKGSLREIISLMQDK